MNRETEHPTDDAPGAVRAGEPLAGLWRAIEDAERSVRTLREQAAAVELARAAGQRSQAQAARHERAAAALAGASRTRERFGDHAAAQVAAGARAGSHGPAA